MTALTVEQVRNMNLPQCHAEIADRWTKAAEIDKKYPNGLTEADNADDFVQQKALLADIDLMETRTTDLEDARLRTERITKGARNGRTPAEPYSHPAPDDRPGRRMTLGQRFTSDEGYRELVKRGAWNDPQPRIAHVVAAPPGTSMVAELKAVVTGLSDTSGGAFVITDRQAYVPQLYAELTVLDLLPVVTTTSDTVDWVTGTFTNAAAPTLEATASTGTTGTKPESSIAFAVVAELVQSIPHHVIVTTRAMADAPQIRGIIDGELMLGLRRVLENQCMNGTGTTPQLRGIFNTTNVQTTAATGTNYADAFFTAQMLVRTNGFVSPTANVMDAAAWSAIRLARENAATGTQGGYLMGGPGVVAPPTLWGLPVVLNEFLPANNGLVGDFTPQSIVLYEREGPSIATGWINDQFVRNLATILAEGRWALGCKRPLSFSKVTGLP